MIISKVLWVLANNSFKQTYSHQTNAKILAPMKMQHNAYTRGIWWAEHPNTCTYKKIYISHTLSHAAQASGGGSNQSQSKGNFSCRNLRNCAWRRAEQSQLCPALQTRGSSTALQRLLAGLIPKIHLLQSQFPTQWMCRHICPFFARPFPFHLLI